MPATFDYIAKASPSGVAAFQFTSIPQNYTDLVILASARVTSASDITAMQANGNNSNYSSVYYEGSGNTIGTGTAEISYRMGYINGTNHANMWSADIIHIFNYSNSNVYKTVISENRYPATKGSTQPFMTQFKAGLWKNTAAITSLTIGTANGGSYASGSTYTLYGIRKA